MADVDRLMDDDDVAVIDDDSKEQAADTTTTTTGATNTGINNKSGGFVSGSGFLTKTRSLSDGGAKETPKLSPAPHIFSDPRRQSQDDIAIRDNKERVADGNAFSAQPSTPVRAGFPIRGLTLQLPQLGEGDALHLSHLQQHPQVHVNHLNLNATSPSAAHSQSHSHSHSQLQSQQQPSSTPAGAPASTSTSSAHVKPAAPAPLSPKLDHSHIYASPSPNILPRRSRGLDFSRAATTLHHSTVVDQASPSSSPTIGSRAMNIPAGPGRWPGEHGTTMEQTSNSLWSVMGNRAHERMHVSSSLGSNAHTSHALFTDTSSSSDDDDIMDEDMEESIVTTPSANKMAMGGQHPWMPGGSSPAVNSLLSFQQRQRRKQPKSRKHKTPLGLGFHPTTPMGATTSMSPPQGLDGPQPRRESISWAANQLHISGSESDDPSRQLEAVDSPSRPGVIRRTVTRHRGNLLVCRTVVPTICSLLTRTNRGT